MLLTKYLPHILIVIFILFFIIIAYLVYISLMDKIEVNNNDTNLNKICMSIDEFNKIKNQSVPIINDQHTVARDRKVLDDDLYPPLNRGDTRSHTNLANNINTRRMYVNTQETGDTFRLVAYVSSTSNDKDSGNNNWKLFARQKDRHFSNFI